MATIRVSYQLTEAGRKAEILAGRHGSCERTVDVEVTPELLAAARVDCDGLATYSLSKRRGTSCSAYDYDAALTPEQAAVEVLRVEAELVAQDKARAEKAAAEKRQEIERAMARWRTEAATALNGDSSYRLSTNGSGEVWVVSNYGSRMQHSISSRSSGIADAEAAMAWESYQSVIAKHAENDRRDCERRDAEEAAKKAKAEAALAERDAWILAHGSQRLKKGLELVEIDRMATVYRDERIAHDLGANWIAWKSAPEPDDKDRLNPEESELDALAEAEERWPDVYVRLRSVGGTDRDGDEHEWRPALMIDCPWDDKVQAIKYLD